MSTAAAEALNRNAEGAAPTAPQHGSVGRQSSLRREMYVREFTSHYDIRPEQIFFDDNTDEPYFDFEALSLLVNQLSDIPSIAVTRGAADSVTGMIDASCTITLADGKTRSYIGSAQLGEPRPGGGQVETWRQALALAQVRALRTALRSVSFDPIKAHETKKRGASLDLQLTDPRARALREAHLLGAELGFIVGEDKTEWRRQIGEFTQGRLDSMEQMDETTRGHWLVFLRALRRNVKGREWAGGVGVAQP